MRTRWYFSSVDNGIQMAPSNIFAPAQLSMTNYSVFRKTEEEKGKLLTAKKKWVRDMKAQYGSQWKKHKNPTTTSVE